MNLLQETLPYEDYSPATGLFTHKDGSLGAVFEAYPSDGSRASVDQVIRSINALAPWFELPSACVLQILYDQSPSPGNEADLSHRVFVSIRRVPSRSKRVSLTFSKLMDGFESTSSVPLRRLKSPELIDLLRTFFSPRTFHRRKYVPVDPQLSLSEQVAFDGPSAVGPDGRPPDREGIKTRTLTLRTLPQFVYPGGLAFLLRLPFPIKLSLNFDAKTGQKTLRLVFSVILEAESDTELEQRVQATIRVFHRELQCDAFLDDDKSRVPGVESLPLNYYPDRGQWSHALRVHRSEAAKLGPVFSEFPGLMNSYGLGVTRRNTLVRLGPTEKMTLGHSIVIGDAVEDKRAFLSSCIRSSKQMDPAPLVFVIRHFAERFSACAPDTRDPDARLVTFGASQSMPINPYRGVFDEEKITFLTRFLTAGIELTSVQPQLDGNCSAAIAAAIRSARWAKLGRSKVTVVGGRLLKSDESGELEITVGDIAEQANRTSQDRSDRAAEMAVRELLPFHGNGIYAKALEGCRETPAAGTGVVFVYDLTAISTHPALGTLMTMAVTEEVKRVMRLRENRGRRGYLILEEIDLLGGDGTTASEFVTGFLDDARSLGLDLISFTSRVKSYFDTGSGRAMWSKAGHVFFLGTGPEDRKYLLAHAPELTSRKCEIIESLSGKSDEYLDMFHINREKSKDGVFRFFLSPLERWRSSTPEIHVSPMVSTERAGT